MNKIFNLIWSKTKEKWIVVSEKVKGNGKVPTSPLFSIAVLTALFSSGGVAYGIDASTLPTGGQITSGTGSITSSGTQMTINQTTQQLIANWATFNIGENAAVRFNQPGIAAVALNRIADRNPSQILGSLTSNGQVFLLNSSGIIFGKNATVNVGGLVASSLNMADSDFLAGKYTLSGNNSAGAILNQGAIKALDGGVVALMAPKVTNERSITANSGSALLAAGNQVTLDFTGDGLINYTVDQGAVDALVENKGLIKADGGVVVMTARAADALRIATATNSGVIEAHTLQNKAGRILLLSDMENGQALVSGTLDASAPNGGDGGFIETSGGRVNISDGTVVTTKATQGKSGMWLIDPTDFTIAATGGNMSGSTLNDSLTSGDVLIESCAGAGGFGDINVNDAVSWSANWLTLTAARDININAVMTASGSASLEMNTATDNGGDSAVPGGTVKVGFNDDGSFKGRVDFFQADKTTPRSATGFLTINGEDYTVINNIGDLEDIEISDSDVYYALGSNLVDNKNQFDPIGYDDGDDESGFEGTFDGLGHTITNLRISDNDYYIGLFGFNYYGTIRNIGLVDAQIEGYSNVGGLVGHNDGTISNSYVTGSVTGSSYVGGLVGHNDGPISNSYSTSSVEGSTNVGGLVGGNDDGTITDSYATGSVTGYGDNVGGLVGANWNTITNSFYQIDGNTILVGDGDGSTIAAQVTPYGINSTLFADWLSSSDGKKAKTLDITKYFTADSDGYYQISSISTTDFVTKGNIQNILGFVNDTNANKFRLTANIDLKIGETNTGFWIPLFNAAELDGKSKTISNLLVNQPMNDNIGMIGYLGKGSSIKNLGVTNLNVSGDYYVGGLVGYSNGGDITSSYATGSVVSTGDNVGGLVGYDFGGDITSSYATGSVVSTGDYVGGLVGHHYDSGNITDSYATGNVTGGDYVGGLAGHSDADITNSYASGTVTGGDYVGGLTGHNCSDTTNSYATGNVSGSNHVGGLAGYLDYTITGSHATGSVTGTGKDVGGLVGYNDDGSVEKSYATGTVNGSDSGNAGGLVGRNSGDITNAYASGAVKGGTGESYGNNGGLVGYNDGDIINTYARGVVTGNGDIGALVGYVDNGSISYSFYDSEANPLLTGIGNDADAPGYVYPMSSANMKLVENYTTATAANGNPAPGPKWDFTPGNSIWKIDSANDGYPYFGLHASETVADRPVIPMPVIIKGQMMEVDLLTPPSGSEPGLVGVSVPQSLWMQGAVFSFKLPDQVLGAASGVGAVVTMPDGTPLPSWLRYNAETMTFTATDIPQEVTEFKVLVTINGKSWVVDVSMKPS